ncbi:MAG: zinc ribbon domain-containing protein [Dehalococcoidia bacterium]|jgi:putative FmdB family regulatory protein|nr:zinc ribbon domain-containing protein [Dehalococcoidia bacterium]
MPIYEYRCDDCSEVTSVFVRSAHKKVEPRCEHCDSTSLTRMMSRVNRTKTEQEVLDELGAPGAGGRPEDAYKDPRQIGRWVEKRFQDYGMDVPDETREMIDAAREGEMPDAVKDL